MRDRILGSVVALAAVLVFSSVTRAQTAEQPGTAKTNTAAPTRDLSGVWMAEDEDGPYTLLTNTNEQPAMTPWGQAQFKEARSRYQKIPVEDATNNDPHLRCDPPGVPRVYLFTGALEVIQTPNRVFIFYEEGHYWREIWMDGRALPKDPDPTYMGYSVGRWQEDTLIVDTIGFNDKTWLDHVGHPHSEALHVVERFRRVDNDTLQVTFMFDDPKAYDKAWAAASRIYKLKPARELAESFCVPGDDRSPDKAAKSPGTSNK